MRRVGYSRAEDRGWTKEKTWQSHAMSKVRYKKLKSVVEVRCDFHLGAPLSVRVVSMRVVSLCLLILSQKRGGGD